MTPKPAQYLLRFDDLCPTYALDQWERYEELLREFAIKPILSVVPENRDRGLERGMPDADFWTRMRALEADGAAIGLHGYRHICFSEQKGLFPIHGRSEFIGVPAESQREWISAGVKILRGHGLNPRIWVAPRHGFDRWTLEALRAEGIHLLSDGLAREPFLRSGMVWIPQQIWGPVLKTSGLWTICIHPNVKNDELLAQMRSFLREHAAQFTSLDRVLDEWKPARLSLREQGYEVYAVSRARLSRLKKRMLSAVGNYAPSA